MAGSFCNLDGLHIRLTEETALSLSLALSICIYRYVRSADKTDKICTERQLKTHILLIRSAQYFQNSQPAKQTWGLNSLIHADSQQTSQPANIRWMPIAIGIANRMISNDNIPYTEHFIILNMFGPSLLRMLNIEGWDLASSSILKAFRLLRMIAMQSDGSCFLFTGNALRMHNVQSQGSRHSLLMCHKQLHGWIAIQRTHRGKGPCPFKHIESTARHWSLPYSYPAMNHMIILKNEPPVRLRYQNNHARTHMDPLHAESNSLDTSSKSIQKTT